VITVQNAFGRKLGISPHRLDLILPSGVLLSNSEGMALVIQDIIEL